MVDRLTRFRDEFLAGVGFVYGIFDADEAHVLGEIGLMPRVGPGAVEIGYWIRADRTGRGLATEATRALTATALELPGVDRVEIHCDAANAPSAAVPRTLGYRLRVDPHHQSPPSGAPPSGGILVFELTAREPWTGRPSGA